MKRFAIALFFLAWSGMSGALAHADPIHGQDDYMRYCSACHGESADGQGPVANVMTPPPPRLTTLTPKFGAPLGTLFVSFVMGTTMPRAHGESDMPVWGKNLAEEGGDDGKAIRATWRIAAYLDTVQARGE